MSFNKNLKKLRENRGYTQQEMANFLKISPQAYSRYETTDQEPKIGRVIEIAEILDVEVDALINELSTYDFIKNESYVPLKKYLNSKGYTINYFVDHIEFGKDDFIFIYDYGAVDDLDRIFEDALTNFYIEHFVPSKLKNNKEK